MHKDVVSVLASLVKKVEKGFEATVATRNEQRTIRNCVNFLVDETVRYTSSECGTRFSLHRVGACLVVDSIVRKVEKNADEEKLAARIEIAGTISRKGAGVILL